MADFTQTEEEESTRTEFLQNFTITDWSKRANKFTRVELVIRQQPTRGRMCGFSDLKDRRLLDPTPIVQVIFWNDTQQIYVSHEEAATLICQVSLWSPSGREDRSIVVNPRGGFVSTISARPSYTLTQSTALPSTSYPPISTRYISKDLDRPTITSQSHSLPPPADPGSVDMHDSALSPSATTFSLMTSRRHSWSSRLSSTLPLSSSSVLSNSSYATQTPALVAPPAPEPGSLGHLSPNAVSRSRQVNSIVGTHIVECSILNDITGTPGMFFIFNDLSVRTQGSFRLKFTLVDTNTTVLSSPILASAMTDVFELYSPKLFPGMTASSALAKAFARQGAMIHIRKEDAKKHKRRF